MLFRDRATLSEEVGHFNRRATQDDEDKDKLYIQADMWRTKYKASKLVIYIPSLHFIDKLKTGGMNTTPCQWDHCSQTSNLNKCMGTFWLEHLYFL